MKRAGELLAAFLDQQTLGAAREYSALFSSWRSIAGDSLAAHSWIRELEHSILLVEADHPGWIQMLQIKEKDLLDALRRRFPDQRIAGISFRLSREPPSYSGGPPLRPRDETAGTEVQEPPAGFDSGLVEESLYEKIGDDHFRETLRRLEESIRQKK
jgi:predicted nucleic acid-binding Zn ribbon protein